MPKRIEIRVSDDFKTMITELSQQFGKSMTDIIVDAVRTKYVLKDVYEPTIKSADVRTTEPTEPVQPANPEPAIPRPDGFWNSWREPKEKSLSREEVDKMTDTAIKSADEFVNSVETRKRLEEHDRTVH